KSMPSVSWPLGGLIPCCELSACKQEAPPMSRRRKWFLLILAVLVLAALAAMWLQPVSPLRTAYNQIRVGMNAAQVAEVLERCGWSRHRTPGPLTDGGGPLPLSSASIFFQFVVSGVEFNKAGERIDMLLTYQGDHGETLTIRWQGQSDGLIEGHVAGKEYQSG